MNAIQELIDEQGLVLADGTMGTMLFASGLEHGDSPELWNVEHPDRVGAVHRAYLDAGSQIILTNTFGGTRYRLQLHNLDGRVAELNRAAVRLLREEVAKRGKRALVAGDIGPSGQLLQPLGDLTFEEAVDGFAEQASANRGRGRLGLDRDHVSFRGSFIDYTKEDFTQNGLQYDLILAVNGYHPLSAYKRALTPQGIYVFVGGLPKQTFHSLFLRMHWR